ncbi:MAG: polysaccharide deacetylase family protein [Deltaproteobacteria bacterium]|nr:polysaccharide deacetylase family protein [Deltaproteobacteria bacterium]
MKNKLPFRSPAEITGIIILIIAAAVFFVNSLLAIAIALFYILLCVAAAFFPQSNFYLPVISRGNTGKNFVALTFDDGPTEPITRQILALLDKYSVKATFFVSGVSALKHPEIIAEIIARGHTIGNHSFNHNPFLMLGSYNYLYQEIFRAQEVLKKMGVQTFAFRPPVGIISPKLPSVLNKQGMFCLTFSCYASDAGNRFIKNLSFKILKKVKADDIIVLHDVPPRGKEDSAFLLQEVEKILQGIIGKGFKVVPLSTLIGKEIN